jgi:hypothetical protein
MVWSSASYCYRTALLCSLVRSTIALNISIVTYGISVPGILSGLALVVPAMRIAANELTVTYGFNVSLVVLSHPTITNCESQLSNFDMVSEYYYKGWDRRSLFVIITPGNKPDLCAQSAKTA